MTEMTHRDVASGLVFAGLQGMIDPPRPEAMEAIAGCQQAGIRVVMITGDHAVTAGAIAAKLGIAGKDAEVLTGRDLEEMDDEKLFARTETVNVYARVSPQHKLRITEQLKKQGHIVAITGDGVNDAPALKSAHIGIAMGRSGTDVAREASDMVLTDDNFASVPVLQWVFRTEPISGGEWVQILIVSSSVIAVVEIDKFFRRRTGERK